MGTPVLTDSGQRLYDALTPLATEDDQNGFALANYCAALAAMVDPVAAIVRDPDADDTTAVPGWATLFDVNNVDASWLPWLAQFVGVDLSNISDVPTQRGLIQAPIGYERGTLKAMRLAAQATLTGTKTVLIYARTNGNAWTMSASTLASETPNWRATRNALLTMKPAGLVLTYTLVIGGTYSQLASSHATYSAMEAAHTTYADIPANPGA